MADHLAEGPHSWAHRIQLKARGAKWAWTAATMNLEQNLQATEDYAFAGVEDLRGMVAMESLNH